LKYLYKPVNDLIDQQLQQWMFAKLSTLLLNLQAIGHTDAVRSILWTVLFYHPQNFLKNSQEIRDIISTNRDYFVQLYETHINSHFVGWDSKNFFALAYLGRGSITSSVLDRLMDIWLEFDIDYILLKQDTSLEQKKIHLSKLKGKIYALWDDAKYMLRDYIKSHPHSLLAL
jgi:hypothetical protein